jgi:hypothetical protein
MLRPDANNMAPMQASQGYSTRSQNLTHQYNVSAPAKRIIIYIAGDPSKKLTVEIGTS